MARQLVLDGELFVALRTLEWPESCVLPVVVAEGVLTHKRFVAFQAWIGAFVTMQSLMFHPAMTLRQTFFTVPTLKRFLVCVRSFVSCHVAFLTEGLITETTGKRTCPRMGPFMIGHLASLHECAITETTRVLTIADVILYMSGQITLFLETLVTVQAFKQSELFTLCMTLLIILQLSEEEGDCIGTPHGMALIQHNLVVFHHT